MEEISLESTVVRRKEIMFADVSSEETVMMNLERGAYYGLPAVSSYIWNEIEEARPVSALCSHLLARFDVDRQTCEREVLAFLNQMLEEDLIRVVGAGE